MSEHPSKHPSSAASSKDAGQNPPLRAVPHIIPTHIIGDTIARHTAELEEDRANNAKNLSE